MIDLVLVNESEYQEKTAENWKFGSEVENYVHLEKHGEAHGAEYVAVVLHGIPDQLASEFHISGAPLGF